MINYGLEFQHRFVSANVELRNIIVNGSSNKARKKASEKLSFLYDFDKAINDIEKGIILLDSQSLWKSIAKKDVHLISAGPWSGYIVDFRPSGLLELIYLRDFDKEPNERDAVKELRNIITRL